MDHLRILHLTPFLRGGGVGNVALFLTKEFVNMGHEIILASPETPPNEVRNKIEYFVKLHNPKIKDPFYPLIFTLTNKKRINSILDAYSPDIILTHGPLILISRYIKKIPIFSIIHGTYTNEVKFFRSYPLFGAERIKYVSSILLTHLIDTIIYKIFSKFDRAFFIAVSKNTKKELLDIGVNSTKVFSVLNGVDKSIFIPRNKEKIKEIFGESYSYPIQNNKIILHVNPGPRKGTHILIDTARLLKTKFNNNIILLIAGKIMHRTFGEHLTKKIYSYGMEENILFLGYVDDELLKYLYNIADLTVVPSYSEGSPLVIPESLASGTPVVATNVGGNREYLALAGLDEFILNIDSYDFSRKLADICENALNSNINIKLENIPSWHNVAIEYLKIFKNY